MSENNVSEYIVCKECQKKIDEETYVEVNGSHVDIRSGENGFYRHTRQQAIYDAIQKLKNKVDWFDSNYVGVKNYDGFGDQRTDCEHGYGPRHGSIVFKISLKERYRNGNLKDWQKEKAIGYLNKLLKANIDKHGYGIKV